MELGIFAKTFARDDVAGTLAAVAAAGFATTQFNLSVLGLPTVPDRPVDDQHVDAVEKAAASAGVRLAAISGTFNTAHPDPAHRRELVERFAHLTDVARRLRIPVITLCSGSRDPRDMWAHHPDNATAEAWHDSRETLTQLVAHAENAGVSLAVEPELHNVVSSAGHARRMLDEIGSPALRIVFDPANLVTPEDATRDPRAATDVARRSAGLLAGDLVLAHAKEVPVPGQPATGAGAGVLDWFGYLGVLRGVGYDGSLVVHGLGESDVPGAVATLAPLVGGRAA